MSKEINQRNTIKRLKELYNREYEEDNNIIMEYKIDDLLNLISDAKRRDKLFNLLMFVLEDMKFFPASIKHHQNFKGGLYIHTMHVMNYALKEFLNYPIEYSDLSIDSIIIVSFIHDLGKVKKYEINKKFEFGNTAEERKYPYEPKEKIISEETYVMNLLSQFGITLDDDELNALDMTHGVWSDKDLKMRKLAHLMHTADIKGSQIIRENCKYDNNETLQNLQKIKFIDFKTYEYKEL